MNNILTIRRMFSLLCAGMVVAGGYTSLAEEDTYGKHEEIAQTFYSSEVKGVEGQKLFDEKSSADDYISYSFMHNNELKASFRRWEYALEKARQAGYLDEPVLTFEQAVDKVDLDYRIGLSQPIPWYGKRALRKKIGVAEADAAMYQFETIKTELFMMVVKAFNEYLYLGRVIEVAREDLSLLSDLEKVVQAKYKANGAEFSDLTKVQVEIDKLKNELATFKDERLVRSSRLASQLDLDTETLLPWPASTERAQADIPEDVLFDLLADLNPELKVMASVLERDGYAKRLAGKSHYPNFTIGAGWMQMPENEARESMSDTSFMVGIKIPLWQRKYASERRGAAAMVNATREARTHLKNNLKVELREAIFKSKDASRRIRLFEDSLIPKGVQALEVARQDYTNGKTGFMMLIDAQRTLLEFKIMRERALADRGIALAEIGCCVGKYGSPSEWIKEIAQENSGKDKAVKKGEK